MIQSICDALAIPINEMKIRKYVTEKTAQVDNSTENGIEVDLSKIVEIDYDELRKKLCHINDIDNILTNFVIEVILVLDENGITGNYRVDLMEKKMKQYISFVSPYHTKKEENSLEHLYQNIAFSIDNLATRLLMVETNSVIEKSSYFLSSNHQNGYFNNPD